VSSIRADGLVKRYGDHTVLAGVDLHVAQGEVVCVIGPSGSGKSTLLRCLNLLERPTEGRIFLGDEEITAAGSAWSSSRSTSSRTAPSSTTSRWRRSACAA
jgi:ABC-type histidine transport system ATPase subunit